MSDLCVHFRTRCPHCGEFHDVEFGPMSFEERKKLVSELEQARRKLLAIVP